MGGLADDNPRLHSAQLQFGVVLNAIMKKEIIG
jgi:hypothetical protein